MLVPYQEIQALDFPNSPRKLRLYEKPWACISWYGPCTQLVNSKYYSLRETDTVTDTVDLHQHGHGTVLFFLFMIKNYRIQDTTYSEVDSKCEIDSFYKLQIPKESTEW